MKATCSIADCAAPTKARGWCDTHYMQWFRKNGPARRTPLENLMRKVEKQPGADGCWIWTGAKTRGGYGNLNLLGVTTRAHRAAYMLLVGEIPVGLVLDHLCMTKACVRPDHLEPVTPAENTRRWRAYVSRWAS